MTTSAGHFSVFDGLLRHAVMLSVLAIATIATAQTSQVRGWLLDADIGQRLPGGHAYLMDTDSAVIRAAVSDENGAFLLEGVRSGQYILIVTYVGYHDMLQNLRVGNTDLDLGAVEMISRSEALEGVRIVEKVPMATQIGDTTQFNAEAFSTMPDASAEDLVEKLPGVVVEDGKVEAMGEQVEQVLVDGRPFFRNDPTAALKTLPAEVVDKIQIFDKESDQAEFTGFSDGQTQKTMNIILRPEMRNGTFGKFSAGLGYEDDVITGGFDQARTHTKFAAGGNVNFFDGDRRITLLAQSNNINQQNFATEDLLGILSSGRGGGRGGMGGGMRGGLSGGGRGRQGSMPGGGNMNDFLVGTQPGIATTHSAGINYSDLWGRKWDVTASYFFNYSDTRSAEDLHRLYTIGADSGQVYDEFSLEESVNMNHRLNARLEYTINEKNSLFLRPRLTIQKNDGMASFTGLTVQGDQDLNCLENENSSELGALDFSNTLLYRHKFDKDRRTLSLNVNTRVKSQDGESFLASLTDYYTPPPLTEELDQYSSLLSSGWALSGNLMFTEPLGKNGMAQFKYMASFQEDDSDKFTYNYDPVFDEYLLLDTLLSNEFNNHYLTQRAGAGYQYFKGKLYMTTRLEFQNATLYNEQFFPYGYDLNKSYNNLLVTAMMRYRIARTRNLNLVYRTYTSPPSITQLQDVVDNSNTVQLKTGNPDLEPSYTHSLMARYSHVKPQSSRIFFAMLAANLTKDYIGNHTLYASGDTLLGNGLELKTGTQLIVPENLDGYANVRSFITYGLPVNRLQSNLNLNLGYTYTRNPGLVNDIANFSNNHKATFGLVLSSNVSEYLDFTLSSRTSYSVIRNSYNVQQDYNYLDQRTRVRFKGVLPESRFMLESNLTHRLTSGLSDSYDQNNWIWSAAIGKKLFGNGLGEIKLGIYDILEQSQAITRTVGDIYIEDIESNILQRYVMLTFTYNLRQFEPPPRGSPDDMRKRMIDLRREID